MNGWEQLIYLEPVERFAVKPLFFNCGHPRDYANSYPVWNGKYSTTRCRVCKNRAERERKEDKHGLRGIS